MSASKSVHNTTDEKSTLKSASKVAPKIMPKNGIKPKNVASKPKSDQQDKTHKTATKPLKSGKPKKEEKVKKEKVIRDSFTMPKRDFEKIAELKKQCLKLGVSIKKSEILRAGLHTLSTLTPQQLKIAVSGVEKIKTGRPS